MGGNVLNTTVKEKDLGFTISADMKVSEQCGIAAAKGNQLTSWEKVVKLLSKSQFLSHLSIPSTLQLHSTTARCKINQRLGFSPLGFCPHFQ